MVATSVRKEIGASGAAKSEVYRKPHWEPDKRRDRKKCNHIDISFDAVLDPAAYPVLDVKNLQCSLFRESLWKTRSGGIHLTDDEAKKLESLWGKHLREISFRRKNTREVSNIVVEEARARSDHLSEGKLTTIKIDVHERNPRARKECITCWGCACVVCGMEFGQRYGEIGNNYIHVHHLRPMAKARRQRTIDPINDLRPVCPNCHAMLHAATPPLTITQLQSHFRGLEITASRERRPPSVDVRRSRTCGDCESSFALGVGGGLD